MPVPPWMAAQWRFDCNSISFSLFYNILHRGIKKQMKSMKRENKIIAVKDLTLRKESLKNLGLPGFDWSLSFFVEWNRETGYNHIWSSTSTIKTSSETQGQSVGPGEKARRKFSSTGGRAPGYRLPLDHFQTSWLLIGHKKCFVLLCPIGEQHLLSSFREFVHEGYWLDHDLSGSCTQQMHTVRRLSVWYKHFISK